MGIPTLIGSAHTASGATSIDITSGIDSTYDEYMFVLTDINPATDNEGVFFNGSTDGGSNYNVVKTTTMFRADSEANFGYNDGNDLAQSTGDQELNFGIGNDAYANGAGILHLFNPASTTYVKHFYSRMNIFYAPVARNSIDAHVAGYFNTTSAINAVRFGIASGVFDGVIQMYGIA